jgi:hypothetical protein
MVIFHSFLYVYQKVSDFTLRFMNNPFRAGAWEENRKINHRADFQMEKNGSQHI